MRNKILSFVLCLSLALFPLLSLTALADTSAEPDSAGPLAITEICGAPEDDKYEFIEIINTSEGEVSLADYYIYRFGFSHSGKYELQGLQQLYGGTSGQRCAKLAKVSLSGVNVKLAKNEIAVIWFCSITSKDESTLNFTAYWENKGNDLTNVKVVKLDVHDGEKNLYPATDINSGAGTGFLPNQNAGYAVSLIKISNLEKTISVTEDDVAEDVTLLSLNAPLEYTQTAALHEAADCIAFKFTGKETVEGISSNYYGFVDQNAYQNACADSILMPNGKTPSKISNPYPAVMTAKPESNGAVALRAYCYMTTAWSENTVSSATLFVKDGTEEAPTPGALRTGQFGNDISLVGTQNKLSDFQTVRFIGYVDSLNYTKVGIRISAVYADGMKPEIERSAHTVYHSLIGGEETYTAASFGKTEGYLMAFAVDGLPLTDDGSIVFHIVTFGETLAGVAVIGEAYDISLAQIMQTAEAAGGES